MTLPAYSVLDDLSADQRAAVELLLAEKYARYQKAIGDLLLLNEDLRLDLAVERAASKAGREALAEEQRARAQDITPLRWARGLPHCLGGKS